MTNLCQEDYVLVRLIKEKDFIYYNFNNTLFISKFPTDLKKPDAIPVHKTKEKTNIDNCRPISILLTLSKIYERCMYDQMYSYFNPIFKSSVRV